MTIQQHASFDSSAAELNATSKLVKAWESKNAKNAARAGGVSLMALSLAACGGSSTTTTTPVVDTPVVDTPVVETPTAPVVNTITKALLDFASGDTLAGTDGDDVLNIELNSDLANTTTISGIETVNVTAYGAVSIDMKLITDVDTFASADSTGAITLNTVSDAGMGFAMSGSGTNSITANYKAGTLSAADDTVSLTLTGATGAVLDVDAGFEAIAINSGDATATSAVAASTITTLTMPGVTSAAISGDGALTIADGQLNSVASITAEGAGTLKLGTMTGIKTLDASAKTGAVAVAATDATTGVAADSITGVAAGSTIQTGSGADHIDFVSGASAGKTNTVKTGAGDDTIEFTAGSGYAAILGEAGADTITVTDATDSNDYIDGGAGTDTLTLEGSTNTGTIRNVENITLTGADALDATNVLGSVSVTAKAGITNASTASDVSVTNLTAGSSVNIVDSSATLVGGVDNTTVGYKATEAAATVDFDSAVVGDIDVAKVTALTLDFAKAATLSSEDLTIDDTTSLVINAAKAIDLGDGISSASTDKLASINATGSDAVDLGDILNSDKLATLDVTAAKAATVGAIAGAKALTSVEVTAGSTATATVGDVGGTTAADALATYTVSGGTVEGGTSASAGAISATNSIGDVTVTGTEGAVGLGNVGVDNTGNTGSIGTVTATATKGALTVGTITSDKSLGTVEITSTAGDINYGDITAKDTTGITVNLSAKTAIDDGAGTPAASVVKNTAGDVTSAVGGAASALVNYFAGGTTAATAGVVNLTASNTGGATFGVDNNAISKDGATSSIVLGNAKSGKANVVNLEGTADTVNVTGGSGADTLQFVSAVNVILDGTFSMGGGTDTVDFTNIDATGDNASSHTGLVINLGSSAVSFDAGTAVASSVAASTVAQYDDNAASTVANVDAKGSTFTLNDVENVIGTANADYIVANATGTHITGGAGADTIVLGAGADTVSVADDGHVGNTIKNFDYSDKDVIEFVDDTALSIDGTTTMLFKSGTAAALKTAIAGGGTPVEYNVLVITDAITTFTEAGIDAVLTAAFDTSNSSADPAGVIVVAAAATGNAKVFHDADGSATNATAGAATVTLFELDGVVLADLANLTADNFSII